MRLNNRNELSGDSIVLPIDLNGSPYNFQLPDPMAVNFYRHTAQRRIWLDGDVGDNVLMLTDQILLWNEEDKGLPVEERKPIILYIFNYGGSADHCWEFIDVIKLSTTPVITVNMGHADSAAALIFIAGHKRLMLPNATVCIHEGSAELGGDAIKVIDAADTYKAGLKKMKEYILSRTGIDPRQLNKKRSNDWTIDAKYCLDNKVCDGIVSSLDEVL